MNITFLYFEGCPSHGAALELDPSASGEGGAQARRVQPVRLDLARADHVSLRIFDVGGRLVRTLANQRLPRDRHAFLWDGADENGVRVPSGAYFYQLRTSDFVQTRKMIVTK